MTTSQKKTKPAHVLVIGGSGMLTQFCLTLSERGYTVSVVCRSAAKFQRNLGTPPHGPIHPIYVDYRNNVNFGQAIHDAIVANGPIHNTIGWIHSEQSLTAPAIAAMYTRGSFYVVLGSSDGKWDDVAPVLESVRAANQSISIYAIALGHMRSRLTGCKRWLTDWEISTGVLEAFDNPQPHSVVGSLD